MSKKSPDFQETLKRMLSSPPKENVPLHAEGKNSLTKSAKKKKQAARSDKNKAT